MIKRIPLKRHRIKENKYITCESMTRTEATEWVYEMIRNGFDIANVKIEENADNTLRCVIEYSPT